jgi:hypothetical protein
VGVWVLSDACEWGVESEVPCVAFLGGIGPGFTENVRIKWAEGKAVARRRERRVECMSWSLKEGVDYREDFSSLDEHCHVPGPEHPSSGHTTRLSLVILR